jgi:hypothetical protein
MTWIDLFVFQIIVLHRKNTIRIYTLLNVDYMNSNKKCHLLPCSNREEARSYGSQRDGCAASNFNIAGLSRGIGEFQQAMISKVTVWGSKAHHRWRRRRGMEERLRHQRGTAAGRTPRHRGTESSVEMMSRLRVDEATTRATAPASWTSTGNINDVDAAGTHGRCVSEASTRCCTAQRRAAAARVKRGNDWLWTSTTERHSWRERAVWRGGERRGEHSKSGKQQPSLGAQRRGLWVL